ncbi:MAG TPA: hypothetical protein PKH65_07930, partial [Bacteroidia bacterium]|nr:hypothetical protein [Bacteroidia bacterium]
MKLKYLSIVLVLLFACSSKQEKPARKIKTGMAEAMNEWYHQRSYPNALMDYSSYETAFNNVKWQSQNKSMTFAGQWEAKGPMNFGGRTLCMAFNPQNASTIWIGSASGGLWKSYSDGIGPNAWHNVATGFPVLGVAAIAIHPSDSNIMYIGTGEVYNYQNTGTGFSVRTTRGSYGIGILKSTDGGDTWNQILSWDYDDLKGVQDLIINSLNPNTIIAATTEGILQSFNAGNNWSTVLPTLMCTDLSYQPGDTNIVLAACGNSGTSGSGIYRSTDGGQNFTKVLSGLPSSYSGKAQLCFSTSSPDTVYASIGNQFVQVGLYRSVDAGVNWTLRNSTDICKYQGWYSHDVAVHPSNPNIVIQSGVDTYKSTNGGQSMVQKSYWYLWDLAATPIGGPEGPPDYMHGDVHHIYYHPVNANWVYFVNDGGVFRSSDGGETFNGINGSYQTQQFYANFSVSKSDSLFAIGGLQDNATPVYEGNLSWRRVIGGDGICTAIHPQNDSIVYASYQNLNMARSDDRAQNFTFINNWPSPGPTSGNFAGIYVVSNASPSTLFVGFDKIYKSTDGGFNWNATNSGNPIDGNPVQTIALSDNNANILYCSTAPVVNSTVGVYRSINGGNSYTNISIGLPNRFVLDFAIHPNSNNVVFAAIGGFGTPHLYTSPNSGSSWQAIGNGLPDVPLNTIVIDPMNPLIVYAGSDIGIFVSIDG